MNSDLNRSSSPTSSPQSIVEERGAGAELAKNGSDGSDGLSFLQHMIAGSIAGMVEHMAMYPVDTIKTRLQALRVEPNVSHVTQSPAVSYLRPPLQQAFPSSPSVYQALSHILKSEGPVGLYRGIGAMGLGAGPAHAVYFALYELAKDKLGGNEKGHHPLQHATAGALATVCMDAVLTPMDVVKQRLQLRRSPYAGVFDCCNKLIEQEGFRAFYTSYRTTLVMNIPFTAVHFATYEAAKRALGEMGPGGGEGSEDSLVTQLVAGGAAGALASAVTNPLDVVKTRLQCQGVCGVRRFKSGSVLGTLRSLVEEEGPGVLWKGVRARVLFHTPAAAICWGTYESCKTFLKHLNEKGNS